MALDKPNFYRRRWTGPRLERAGRSAKQFLLPDSSAGEFDLAAKVRELRAQGFADGDEIIVVSWLPPQGTRIR